MLLHEQVLHEVVHKHYMPNYMLFYMTLHDITCLLPLLHACYIFDTCMITCTITRLFTAYYMNCYIDLHHFTWDECLCARAGHAFVAAPAEPVAPASPHGDGISGLGGTN